MFNQMTDVQLYSYIRLKGWDVIATTYNTEGALASVWIINPTTNQVWIRSDGWNTNYNNEVDIPIAPPFRASQMRQLRDILLEMSEAGHV